MSSGHFDNALQCFIKGLMHLSISVTDMEAKTLRFHLLSNRLGVLIELNKLEGNEHSEALQHIFRHHKSLSDTQPSEIFYRCAKFYLHQDDLTRAQWCLARCPSSTSDSDPVNLLRTELKRMTLQCLAESQLIQRGTSGSLETSHSVCAICLDDFSDICVSYPCKHAFHEDCLLRWLREPTNTCPSCRCDLLEGWDEA